MTERRRSRPRPRLETDRPIASREAIMACRNGGTVSVIGVYGGFIDKFPMGSVINRSLTIKTGQCHVQRYTRPLLERIQKGEAVGLYALVGALLCLSWLAFFHYLSRHPDLTEEHVDEGFFPGERTRAWAGTALYAASGVLGYLVAPWVALAIFFAVPVFYALTSEGLYGLPAAVRGLDRRVDRPTARKMCRSAHALDRLVAHAMKGRNDEVPSWRRPT